MTSTTIRPAATALLLLSATVGTPAMAFEPGNPECIAPASPGGGWDFTCRQVGKTMQDLDLIPGTMQVTNMDGGGGGVAYAAVVNKRSDDNDLVVAASSSTSTRLAQGAYPGNDMDQVRWLGSVGTDYGIIAVARDSEIDDLPALMDKIKSDPSAVSVSGGSAVGGWDHLKVLLAAQEAGVEDLRTIKYVAFDGGGEAITQLLGGSVQAFTGDASEAKGFVDSGDIKVIAVLSPERLKGDFADFPTAKEQGLDVVGANWRGFYAPGDMSDEAFDYWSQAMSELAASQEWQDVMTKNGLEPLAMTGDEFEAFVADSVDEITTLSKEIGLIK